VFAIRHPREVLHQRIAARVDAMFAAGLVDEVRGLLARYDQLSPTAMQAVGYREVIDHVWGASDLATTRERVLVRTRRFARHQETWFRGLTECRMLDVDEKADPDQVAAHVEQLGRAVRLAAPGH
jgi:tRNA dimethylallyltransferase